MNASVERLDLHPAAVAYGLVVVVGVVAAVVTGRLGTTPTAALGTGLVLGAALPVLALGWLN